jgi:hypothetical protein
MENATGRGVASMQNAAIIGSRVIMLQQMPGSQKTGQAIFTETGRKRQLGAVSGCNKD